MKLVHVISFKMTPKRLRGWTYEEEDHEEEEEEEDEKEELQINFAEW